MRMTIHNGRAGKNGAYNPRHNDRSFDISHAEHIDPERMPGNVYWNWTGKKDVSFEDAERLFYEQHCRTHLDAVNHTCLPQKKKTLPLYDIYERKSQKSRKKNKKGYFFYE